MDGRALPIRGKLLAPLGPHTAVASALPGVLIEPFAVCKVTGCPGALHGEKNCKNAPVGSRGGPSNNTLFQMAFSENSPIPPRIPVFPFFLESKAKPIWGARLLFG